MTPTLLARAIVLAVEIYLAAGFLFAVAFALFGVAAIDPAARGSSVGFRILIVPGSALLWPILLRRWLRGEPPPRERNAHRDAAASATAETTAQTPATADTSKGLTANTSIAGARR